MLAMYVLAMIGNLEDAKRAKKGCGQGRDRDTHFPPDP